MAQTIFKSGIGQKLRNLILPQPSFEEQYCRLCLSPCNSQLKELFTLFNATQNIAEVIQNFAKVTISQDDEYSKVICFLCYVKLRESEDFKVLIETSDFKLKHPIKTELGDNSDSDHEKIDVVELDIKKELILSEQDQYEENENINIKIENSIKEIENSNCKDPLKVRKRRIRKSYKQQNRGLVKKDTKSINCKDPLKVKKKQIRKPYKCPECGKVCKWYVEFKKHMITHTGVYPFHCSFCKKGFVTKYARQVHEFDHTGERNYQCEICGKSSKSHNLLLIHKKSHAAIKPFKCDQCDKSFKSKQTLLMHTANKHSIKTEESNFPCDICNRHYKTKFHLQNHIRQIHSLRSLGTCSVCGKTVRKLNEHVKAHFRLFKCTVCNKSFGTASNLKSHSGIHSDQQLNECSICKKKYAVKYSLLKHMKTHDVKNRFKCEFCDKIFHYKVSLRLHLKRVHPENDN